MQPMRFYLLFDVQGNAAQQLDNIAGQFVNLGAAAMQASSGISSSHGSVIAMIHGLHELANAGNMVSAWGENTLSLFSQVTSGVFNMAAEFESLNARMGFAFGERQAEVWERVQTYARDSVYTFNEVAGIVGQLGVAIPGVAAEFATLPEQYTSRAGGLIDAFHVLGDTASGTGRSINMIGYEAMQMMSGVFRGAHQVLHLTHQETETIKHAISSTTDTAAQFSSIMQVLAAHYGGATQAMAHTFSFLMLQIPDVIQILENQVGQRGLAVLRDTLEDVVKWMRELGNDTAFIASMGDVFVGMAEGVSAAARWGMVVVDHIRQFVGQNPGLVKVGIALGVIAAAMTVIGGTLLSAAAGLTVFITSVSMAGAALFTGFSTALMVITAVGAALAGLVAFGGILKVAFENDLGGIATAFRGIGLIVEGLGEAFHYWNGDITAITEGMAEKLRDAGLLNFFVNLVSWIARAREWTTGFLDGIQAGIAQINMSGLLSGFDAVARSLEAVGISLHLLEPAAETSFETMQGRGFSFATLLNQVLVPALNILIGGFQLAAWTLESVVMPSLGLFASVTMSVLEHWRGFTALAAGIALYFAPLPALIFLILNATNGWGTALNAVGAVFSVIITAAEFLFDVVLRIGEGIANITSFTGFSSGSQETEGGTSSGSSWNPFSGGVPTTVHDGSSSEPTPIQINVPPGNGRVMDALRGGGEGGVQRSDIERLIAILRETRGNPPVNAPPPPQPVDVHLYMDDEHQVSRAMPPRGGGLYTPDNQSRSYR